MLLLVKLTSQERVLPHSSNVKCCKLWRKPHSQIPELYEEVKREEAKAVLAKQMPTECSGGGAALLPHVLSSSFKTNDSPSVPPQV